MSSTDTGSDLKLLEQELLASIAAAGDLAAIEQARIAVLGKKGRIAELMQTLGTLPPEQRKGFGQSVNEIKTRVSEALEARKASLEGEALSQRLVNERADVTLPVRPGAVADGRIHPVSQVYDECVEIFADMGFAVAEGPDIETDDLNFTKLNIPPEHPARQEHDTFYFRPKEDGSRLVLRTHTSPVQIRTMLAQKPPIRIIAPGRVYRIDSDATHTPMFHQIEALVIDEGTHLGQLKWCIEEFVRAIFGIPDLTYRLRPSHFPFTEPSAEMDVQCGVCKGAGCGVCKGTGWVEILGSGMVHPSVLEAAGVDSERYTGWAFGMGPARIALTRYGIPDIRVLYDSDVRFLEGVGGAP